MHQHSNNNNNNPKQQENHLRNNDPDLTSEALMSSPSSSNQHANGTTTFTTTSKCPFSFVPLRMGGNGRTHQVSQGSKRLIEQEVSLADLEKMTHLFYETAFADATLDKFIRSHSDPHGFRFAKWIHQKLSGSTVWDQDRYERSLEPVELAGGHLYTVHDRTSAHVAAWNSPKRPAHEVGRHFQLDECRVWMRLHFWAMRQSGIMETSPSFADYYVRFISHFVRIYESSAPAYARESLRWSADPKNIETYIQNGRQMNDVLGLSQQQAQAQIPASELNDTVWPYIQ